MLYGHLINNGKNGVSMSSKLYRLHELINPADSRSLVIDTSNALSVGSLPGLEDFSKAVIPLLSLIDGIVTSPGQARNLSMRTHQDAALIVRGNWTNALRGDDFVLPPEKINYVSLLTPSDALDLGAAALVIHFLLGYEEEIEAKCLHQAVHLSLEGARVGMPILVDVQPTGPRVALWSKAIELGVSYILESGADGIAIPWPGGASLETIQKMAGNVPVWVKPGCLELSDPVFTETLVLGCTGFWLNEGLFTTDDPGGLLRLIAELVHATVEA
jgi:DhnA family fructose-bisphosphate aldolase class Ia